MNLPTGTRGRWVAMGLLLIVLTALVKLAFAPLWQRYQAVAPAIAEQQDQLQRYQKLAARMPALQEQHQALLANDLLDDYLLPGANNSLAAASLQQRLQSLAQDLSGRVLSTRVLKPQPQDGFERVTVNARLQIDLNGLQRLLYGLESQTPYLYVENLGVYRNPGRSHSPDNLQLEVQLDVYGLRLPEETVDG